MFLLVILWYLVCVCTLQCPPDTSFVVSLVPDHESEVMPTLHLSCAFYFNIFFKLYPAAELGDKVAILFFSMIFVGIDEKDKLRCLHFWDVKKRYK